MGDSTGAEGCRYVQIQRELLGTRDAQGNKQATMELPSAAKLWFIPLHGVKPTGCSNQILRLAVTKADGRAGRIKAVLGTSWSCHCQYSRVYSRHIALGVYIQVSGIWDLVGASTSD